MPKFISKITDKAKEQHSKLTQNLSDAGSKISDTVKETFASAQSKITQNLSDAGTKISDTAKETFASATETGSSISKKIGEGGKAVASKISAFTPDANKMLAIKQDLQIEFQTKFSALLSDSFDSVIKEREGYFEQHPDKIPNKQDVTFIISHYSSTNAVLTGALNLVPGPWGLLTAVPEMVTITKNQISMAYDIGLACGKKEVLHREVLMHIVIDAMGNAAGALAVMQGSKLIVKKASVKVMQKILERFGVSIAQKALSKLVSASVPLLGAAILATWSKYSTSKIGARATEIFDAGIVFDDSTEIMELEEEKLEEEQITLEIISNDSVIEKEKILCLLALIKIDGQVSEEESEFIKPVIVHSNLPEEEKNNLINLLTGNEKILCNLDLLKDNPNESILLIIDMIALAKRDGIFHSTEKFFIKQIAKQLNFSDGDIADLLS